MYLSKREDEIVGAFLENLDKFDQEEMKLVWENGAVVTANFDTCYNDSNYEEVEEYGAEEEDFETFLFEAIDVTGEPPIFISPHKLFEVSYRNFPKDIFVGDKKIN